MCSLIYSNMAAIVEYLTIHSPSFIFKYFVVIVRNFNN